MGAGFYLKLHLVGTVVELKLMKFQYVRQLAYLLEEPRLSDSTILCPSCLAKQRGETLAAEVVDAEDRGGLEEKDSLVRSMVQRVIGCSALPLRRGLLRSLRYIIVLKATCIILGRSN